MVLRFGVSVVNCVRVFVRVHKHVRGKLRLGKKRYLPPLSARSVSAHATMTLSRSTTAAYAAQAAVDLASTPSAHGHACVATWRAGAGGQTRAVPACHDLLGGMESERRVRVRTPRCTEEEVQAPLPPLAEPPCAPRLNNSPPTFAGMAPAWVHGTTPARGAASLGLDEASVQQTDGVHESGYMPTSLPSVDHTQASLLRAPSIGCLDNGVFAPTHFPADASELVSRDHADALLPASSPRPSSGHVADVPAAPTEQGVRGLGFSWTEEPLAEVATVPDQTPTRSVLRARRAQRTMPEPSKMAERTQVLPSTPVDENGVPTYIPPATPIVSLPDTYPTSHVRRADAAGGGRPAARTPRPLR